MLPRALALAILLVPLGAAHGTPPAYDPLVVEMHGSLHAEGTFSETEPTAGALAFPASTPAAPGAPLRFAFQAPVRFAPAGGFEVELALRADAPIATGDGLELAIEPGGMPQRVALPPLLAPGETATARVTLAGAADHAEGSELALVVRALAPALAENTLFLVLGANASRMDVRDMRVPSVGDLALQDADVVELLSDRETFAPSRPATVHTFLVAHDAVATRGVQGDDWNATYVVLLGIEAEEDAQTHAFADRERRRAAAHALTVGGTLVRVHPGLGVAVPVASLPARIQCVANCPPGGFAYTIDAQGVAAPADRPSQLIPPPREERDVPVSEDGPDEKPTPLPPLAAGFALALALVLRRKVRERSRSSSER